MIPGIGRLPIRGIRRQQFAGVIMEMNAHTGFGKVLRSRKARYANELIPLYAVLIAHATELDAKSATATSPKLESIHISTAMPTGTYAPRS